MTRRWILCIAILAACVAAPAVAAPASQSTTPKRTAKAAEKRPPAASPGPGARRLEDIHISGEIPVPQVLFIRAREQRRFLDFQHGRYLKNSRALGDSTVLPTRVAVTGTRP